jgi:hypothetical protein
MLNDGTVDMARSAGKNDIHPEPRCFDNHEKKGDLHELGINE